MERILTPTRARDLFGPGKDGFTDGNPPAGVATTQLEALYFNHVQEEISNVIEDAGIVLDRTQFDQMLLAIRIHINNQIVPALQWYLPLVGGQLAAGPAGGPAPAGDGVLYARGNDGGGLAIVADLINGGGGTIVANLLNVATDISALGTITGGQLTSTGNIDAAGIITGAQLTSTGNISAVGSVTAAYISSSGNIDAAGAFNGASLNVTADITAGGDISATGAVRASYIFSSGNIDAAGAIGAGTINAVNVNASGTVTGAQLTSTGNINAGGAIAAVGAVSGNYLSSSGNIDAAGTITGANVTATALVQGANVTATGLVQGANVTATATVTGATVNSTGNINALAGTITGAQLVSTGEVTAAGNVNAGRNAVPDLWLGATGAFDRRINFGVVNTVNREFGYYGDVPPNNAWQMRGIPVAGNLMTRFLGYSPFEAICRSWTNATPLLTARSMLQPYQRGLADVLKLEAVSAFVDGFEEMRERGVPPVRWHGIHPDRLRELMPECTSEIPDWHGEGIPGNGFRHGPLLMAYLNAFKEIDARLKALEAALRGR